VAKELVNQEGEKVSEVAPMMVDLMVGTPESIVSFVFF
jgi:hypothetical protein